MHVTLIMNMGNIGIMICIYILLGCVYRFQSLKNKLWKRFKYIHRMYVTLKTNKLNIGLIKCIYILFRCVHRIQSLKNNLWKKSKYIHCKYVTLKTNMWNTYFLYTKYGFSHVFAVYVQYVHHIWHEERQHL